MELVKNFKQSKIIKSLFIVLVGSIILAISSKIKIPFYPVPMTMQTLVILIIGIGFGWKLGMATISLYLFEGIIGLPVFSGTPEKGVGLIYFTGPTMGYLIGFLVAVFFAGKFNYDNNLFKNFIKLTFATSSIYILGIIWLGSLIGWDKPIFELGVQPFLLAELFKILLATFALHQIKKLRNWFKLSRRSFG
jgi:biotin transport system substrate-specific component